MSGVLQAAALDILTSTRRDAHLRTVRQHLRARRDALVQLVRIHLPAGTLTRVPDGGFTLWLRLPPHTDARTVADRCALAGVLVSPGDEWFPTEPTGPFLRLHYAGPHPARFEEGVLALAQAIDTESGSSAAR